MYAQPLKILSWAEEDRPREKLRLKGKSSLSDSELMAILLGSGTFSISAVELAKQILSSVNHNLNDLAKLSLPELQKFRGIGEAKAISIIAAIELGRRRKIAAHTQRTKISTSSDVYHYIAGDLLDLKHEEFWIILLNRRNQVLSKHQISSGGVSGTVADPKIIFKKALEELASAVILIHNHPSGNPKPSDCDIRLTKKIKQSGDLLEIPVVDHLIITDSDYTSLSDEGLM